MGEQASEYARQGRRYHISRSVFALHHRLKFYSQTMLEAVTLALAGFIWECATMCLGVESERKTKERTRHDTHTPHQLPSPKTGRTKFFDSGPGQPCFVCPRPSPFVSTMFEQRPPCATHVSLLRVTFCFCLFRLKSTSLLNLCIASQGNDKVYLPLE